MGGKWRLFRQDAGRASGPPAWVYVLAFGLCVAAGNWGGSRYVSAIIWPANGVLLTAVLQLHRRGAIAVLAAGFAINLVGNLLRGAAPHMVVIFALFNVAEAFVAGMIARRYCGAALDLRRPVRLARFAALAVAPPAAAAAFFGTLAIPVPWRDFWVNFQNWLTVDGLGLLVVAPTCVLLARSHRFSADEGSSPWRTAALLAALAGVTVAVFSQSAAPVTFILFVPLMLVAFGLAPHWSALAVIMVAAIAIGFSLFGCGPFMLSRLPPANWPDAGLRPALRAIPILQVYLATVLALTMTASTFVTERRRLEARVKARASAAEQARRLAERAAQSQSRFLSMMSHELRTPLNGVVGLAELLAARPGLDPQAARQVQQIRHASDELLALVNDILDVSRGDTALASAPFAPAAVLREVAGEAREAAAAKGVRFLIEHDIDPADRRLGDERRVRQILRILLSNAVKFTAEGRVELSLRLDGDRLEARVADTGPGLSSEILERLFQPFAQADDSIRRAHQGSGLGLALCKRLVEAMGGEIGAENGPEGGAVFHLGLPAPRSADALQAAPAVKTGRAPRVLVVDDHPVNREVAALMLQALGCETAAACDGAEAVEAVEAQAWDLILMDVRMPRMDGLEATRRIRALAAPASEIPIVAVTADAMPEDVQRCAEAGMAAHLAKPLTQARLLETLARFLDGRGPAAERVSGCPA